MSQNFKIQQLIQKAPVQVQQKQLKYLVELKVVTWNKDSHGLFDYESKQVDLKYLKVESSCEIYALKNQPVAEQQQLDKEDLVIINQPIISNNIRNLNNQNALFLAAIDINQNSQRALTFELNPTKDSLRTLNSQNQLEPYLIVRSLKNHQNVQKGYTLQAGDIVKFGRIEYQIMQIKNNQNQIFKVDTQQFMHIQQNDNLQNSNAEHAKICKICLSDDQSEENFLINPCNCKGSCEFVHFECLKGWINSKLKVRKLDNVQIISWKKSDCEICKTQLPKHIKYKNQIKDLIQIDIPEKPHIIFESLEKDKKVFKNLFIFYTDENEKEIKIGRGHSSEVRISDISVSRTHSMIKYINNQFLIIDNNSKFGTLIKLKNNIEINQEKKAVQIGRTVITFVLKNVCGTYQSQGNLIQNHQETILQRQKQNVNNVIITNTNNNINLNNIYVNINNNFNNIDKFDMYNIQAPLQQNNNQQNQNIQNIDNIIQQRILEIQQPLLIEQNQIQNNKNNQKNGQNQQNDQ
ncbi:hypothetical protein IMG5_155500 [Ichthyophthirius multifiliis]|uniref:Uncharacterized protein n=1 Tax=Ichthyophthirius multifiliis TaxID=5932 RepID=G0QZB3_ICHMU|nr:hypothetical protein IMG5_155500 [Ichthyophthirius multifiliis]EGR29443.1 hypothetical protein IMG5_155500 [Ichthyophthirius multifiliis]|eukprot:XP_004030679.1 hypothetical protein IMG5_155500 [Ichthyophthirius multifiliis]